MNARIRGLALPLALTLALSASGAPAAAIEPAIKPATAPAEAPPVEPIEALVVRADQAYQAQRYADSASLYAQVMDAIDRPAGVIDAELFYQGARSAARAGRREQALAWLRRAVDGGFAQAQDLREDADFEPLRADRRWPPLLDDAARFAAQRERLWKNPAFAGDYRDALGEDERVAGLSRLWSEAKFAFVHFDRVPELDWDALYLETLPKVRAAASTWDYYRELQAFVARLHDGHSGVYLRDPALRDRFQARPGLATAYVQGRVLVSEVGDPALRRAGVARGWEIVAIDGEPVTAYAERTLRRYIGASTPQDLASRMYERQLLEGPASAPAKVDFKDPRGRAHTLELARLPGAQRAALIGERPPFEWTLLPGNIAWVRLNSFDDDTAADRFDAAFAQIARADALILDVRENGGGNSSVGYRILSLLAARPFAGSAWSTRTYRPAFRAWGLGEGRFQGRVRAHAPDPARRYAGPVLLLTSARTYSAAEDFAVAFDAMGRGRIVGEPTGGSTGQPLAFQLPGGISARICSKRDTYPDGKAFVGVGVLPQVRAAPTVADYRAGRDTVLETALRLARTSPP